MSHLKLKIGHTLALAFWLASTAALGQFATNDLVFDAAGNKTYRVEQVLGKGGFAQVFLVKDVATDAKQALKVFRDEKKSSLAAETYAVMGEVFDDPNAKEHLVQTSAPQTLQDAAGAKWQGQFVELMSSQNLDDVASYFDLTKTIRKATAAAKIEAITRLQSQMVEAQLAMASNGLVHNDIKPSNFLLSTFDGEFTLGRFNAGEMHVELADFDTVSKAKTPMKSGTPPFMPPEKLLDPMRASDVVMDMYAIGATLYEVTFGTSFVRDYLESQDLPPGTNAMTVLAAGDPEAKRRFIEWRFRELKARPALHDLPPELLTKLLAIESLATAALEPDYARRAAALAKQESLGSIREHLVAESKRPAVAGSIGPCQRLDLQLRSTL